MPSSVYKDEIDLAYAANKKRLRCEGQISLDRVMNEAIRQMDEKFNEALSRGEILHIEGAKSELDALLLEAAQKELSRNV